jgi:vacuolar protein sorting-associated protein IST1
VKELHSVRNLLVEKFGKDFALSAMEEEGVAERVLKKLKVETPSETLVNAYLKEICRTYGVPFPGDEDEEVGGDEDDDDGDGGGMRAKQSEKVLEEPLESEPKSMAGTVSQKPKSAAESTRDEEVDELRKATPPRALGPASPLRIAPPSPSSENVTPRIKMPGAPVAQPKKDAAKKKDDGPGGKIPDVDELAKRFAALKR